MILVGSNSLSDNINVPIELIGKTRIFVNCELSNHEMEIINYALMSLNNQMHNEGFDIINAKPINLYFTDDNTISLTEDSDECCALRSYFAVYYMHRIRRNMSDMFMMFCFVEELAHHFWNISDETVVKLKVEQIIRSIMPDFSLDYIKERWKLYGL